MTEESQDEMPTWTFVDGGTYFVSIGWNDDGSLRVEENGEEVFAENAARVVEGLGTAVGWSLLEDALDPDISRRAK